MKPTEDKSSKPTALTGKAKHPSSNLLPALLLLPGNRRRDALLFADWCRLVDDLADDPLMPPVEKRASLNAWKQALSSEDKGDLPMGLQDLIRRRDIDPGLLREIVEGMLMDTGIVRFATFGDLHPYCRRVASAVGLASARIFGASGPAVESYAEKLGIALQLTNILRDIAEDAAMGRIYLPMEDLERFGVSEGDLMKGRTGPCLTHLLDYQAERADSWFAKAELSWSEMSVNQRRLMRPARLMGAVYRELLLAMHRDRYDVFAKRYRVPVSKKLVLLLLVITDRS
jgi:phytoene synthase